MAIEALEILDSATVLGSVGYIVTSALEDDGECTVCELIDGDLTSYLDKGPI